MRCKDHRAVDLISDALPFGRLWYGEVSDATGYATHRSRSHDAVIHVYDHAGSVIETHEHGRVQRAEALLVTARHEPERSVVSITRLHLDIVFDTVRIRVSPAIAIATGNPCTRTLCHFSTRNVLQPWLRWSAFVM